MIDYRRGFWTGLFWGYILGSILFLCLGGAGGYFIGYGRHSTDILPHMTKINDHLIFLERNK